MDPDPVFYALDQDLIQLNNRIHNCIRILIIFTVSDLDPRKNLLLILFDYYRSGEEERDSFRENLKEPYKLWRGAGGGLLAPK